MRGVSFLFSLLMLDASTALAQAKALEILTYPNAGVFESAAGRGPGGPGGAAVHRMQVLSGVRLNQQLMPIGRAMAIAEQKPGHCAVAVSRTPEREARFLWIGPWARGALTVYGRADETRQITAPQDLQGSHIVVLRDSTPAGWLKDRGLRGEEVKDNGTALRMLRARRVDYWLANELAAFFVIRADVGPPPRVLYSAGRIDLYIACHPDSNRDLVSALGVAVAQLRRNGELADFGMREPGLKTP
ncbi:MAG: transporter substrate-binding domain-containing protein [Rubrivivax sp.]|nr:MAG: transporter substrate-binding domain-containing protein [Rubrivivax sp.]